MKPIVIIAQRDQWLKSLVKGEYMQSTLDATLKEVGFIHCSYPDQTIEIANRKYSNYNDLMLLLIDPKKVTPEIKEEGALSGRHGAFPHIYGPLNVNAVYKTIPLEKNDKGEFETPDAFPSKLS